MAKKDYDNWSKTELVREIKKLEKRKKYGILWEDKPEKVATLCKEKLPILEEDTKKEIKTHNEKSVNIMIEGDNYHALSVLNYTHKGKVDVIYIDPPYNTGSKDWKYNNDYVDINDQWRHSKWLSFMEKRLRLAKRLLKRNGVLICTIDKNEHSALGLLLQELFPNREIVCVTIIHNPGGIQGLNFSHTNEYAYFVHPSKGTFISKVKRDDAPQTAFRDWGKETSKRKAAKTCFYPIYVKSGEIIGFGEVCSEEFHPNKSNIHRKDGIIEVYPIDQKGIERKWRFSLKSVEDIKDELVCKKVKNEWVIVREKKDYRWKTVWTENKYNANVYGTKLLNNIIKGTFPYPKSLYAVEDCIKAVIHNKNNATILDFFAGSGTTGHAVLELNHKDGGDRKFILCTNNENNNGDGGGIAEEICYPRVKKIIKGYIGTVDKKQYGGLGGNLKYFKTDFVDAEPTDKNKRKMVAKSTEMLCLKEECFEEVKKGTDFKIFKNSQDKHLGIIYDDDGIEPFKKEVKKLNKKLVVYVFSLDESAREEEFEDMDGNVELKPIPAVILNVYKRIFK
ncbi:MAG: site-specific DNA-methyltransferase [Nanoarchaeota archaeon]|nr:site-specific DNA-methyltransferase [Nanoarchaeota archaeon]MBU1974763.1 site-specific DNA-methyltransferase [Nanoarchaeota archaeon]